MRDDGIGFEAAKTLVSVGHHVLLHGRSEEKLDRAEKALSEPSGGRPTGRYLGDLSQMVAVETLAKSLAVDHPQIDVLINNAGVYRAAQTKTADGLDVRFAVNTVAPYVLTIRFLPQLKNTGRVINLSSAAQSPVDLEALRGHRDFEDGVAYAQSKLALTMWSRHMAMALEKDGPTIIAVNPGSMLGSKMVKEAYGVSGGDLRIGAEILMRLAVADEYVTASGQYFDNDKGSFAKPHPDALASESCDGSLPMPRRE